MTATRATELPNGTSERSAGSRHQPDGWVQLAPWCEDDDPHQRHPKPDAHHCGRHRRIAGIVEDETEAEPGKGEADEGQDRELLHDGNPATEQRRRCTATETAGARLSSASLHSECRVFSAVAAPIWRSHVVTTALRRRRTDTGYRHISCAPNRPFVTVMDTRMPWCVTSTPAEMSAADAHAAGARRVAVVNVGRSTGVQDSTEGL